VKKKFLKRAQNEFDTKVKKIRSDNGIDIKNTQIEDYLDEENIKHEFLTPYTPQQNRMAERKNRTLIEMARTMLNEYKTFDRFWEEAVNTAVDISYAAPQVHRIVNVALHREYSPAIVFIFFQGRNDLYHV
jgi:transposase InsO family protein